MIPGAKVQKNVHTSIKRLLNFVLQIYKIVICVLYMYFILIYKYFLSSIILRLFHTKESPITWDFLKPLGAISISFLDAAALAA